jgi:DNA ligase-1
MSKFRPLLAEKVDLKTLQYPCFASPKYDGFRCLIDNMGNPLSRNMKPIANAYVFGKLKELGLPKFDGELLTYTGNKVDDFNTVQSKLSTRSGMPDFRYMVFDHYAMPTQKYVDRETMLREWFEAHKGRLDRLEHVQQKMVHDEEELLEFEAKCLADGWEGVMVRSIDGPYKFGRSTTKEGILLKLKRFFDAEAVVIEAHELMHNANEAVTNELGYTERSSHKANMQGMDTLGKFTVRWGEVEFDVGTGFSQQQRDQYWRDENRMVGKTLTFKYQSLGPSGKPRFPVFLGFRHD